MLVRGKEFWNGLVVVHVVYLRSANSACIADSSVILPCSCVALGVLILPISRTPGPPCGSRWVQHGSATFCTSGRYLLPWFSQTGTLAIIWSKATTPFSALALSADSVTVNV